MLSRLVQQLSKWYAQQLEPVWFRRRRPQRLAAFASDSINQLPVARLQLTGTPAAQSPLIDRYQRYYRQFCHQQSAGGWQDPAGLAMLLPLCSCDSASQFSQRLKKLSGNFWRDSEKARRAGFTFQPFVMRNHTPDLLAIRRSRKIRAFGPVLDAFTLKLQDLGGPPQQAQAWQAPVHGQYWDLYVGVFRPVAGYHQAAVQTDQQLVAYARLHRIGNMLRYAELMGHAGFQSQGVMNLLHHQLLTWLLQRDQPWLAGIDYLSYGALEQGSDGLAFWKRKALFQPYLLQFTAASAPVGTDAQFSHR